MSSLPSDPKSERWCAVQSSQVVGRVGAEVIWPVILSSVFLFTNVEVFKEMTEGFEQFMGMIVFGRF